MFTAFMVALTLTTVANVLVTMASVPLLTALVRAGLHWPPNSATHLGCHRVAGSALSTCTPAQLAGLPWWAPWWHCACRLAGAVNWTVTQHSHAQGHAVDLMPAVLMGAVLSALITLPLAWPFQASGTTWRLLALWVWCSWPFPACWW
jgi:hypothetical protein